MIPLLLGTAIALAALAYVLAPLFADATPRTSARSAGQMDAVGTDREVDALREIEFDHVTGKLSDSDYVDLRDQYTARAVQSMRADSASVIRCPVCGPRPQRDATYCSECGRPLTPAQRVG